MSLNRATAMYGRFDRFWQKKTFNGIEVYVEKMNFYTNGFRIDEVTKRFMKSIGINWTEFINQDIDSEIETMYFYLKPGFRYSGKRAFDNPVDTLIDYNDPTTEMMSDKFNKQFKVGDIVDVTISYGGSLKRYISEHDLGWVATGDGIQITPLNTKEIQTVLASNPWYYYANSRHIEFTNNNPQFQLYDGTNSTSGIPTAKSTPVCDVSTSIGSLGVTALLDNGSVFQPVLNLDNTIKISNEMIGTDNTSGGSVVKYTYTLSFEYVGCSIHSGLLGNLLNWYDAYYEDTDEIPYELTDVENVHAAKITSQIDTKIKRELFNMRYDPTVSYIDPQIVESSLYLKVPSYVNHFDDNPPELIYTDYLKVDAVRAMHKREFGKLIAKSIDTDYTVESKEWWEVVLFIVIIIVAVVVAIFFPPGGAAIAAVGGAGSAGAIALTVATFAGTMALVITVGSMILAKAGGLSAGGLVAALGKFVAVLGIVAMVAGIYAAIEGFAREIAARELAKEAAKEFGTEAAVDISASAINAKLATMSVMEIAKAALEQAASAVTSALSNVGSVTVTEVANIAMETGKYLMKAYEFYQDQEKGELDKELQGKKDELETLQEEEGVAYTFEPGTFMMHHETLSSPDKLQELAMDIDSRIGRDKTYNRFDDWTNR